MRAAAAFALAVLLSVPPDGLAEEPQVQGISLPTGVAGPTENRDQVIDAVLLEFATEQIAQCCKICRKGKACGNSCINKSYTCRKPQGCACDAKQ